MVRSVRLTLASALVLPVVGGLAAGCPDQEIAIEITAQGAAQLFLACFSPKSDCVARQPDPAAESPCGEECELAEGRCWRRNACRLEGRPPPRADAPRQLRVFLADPERGKIRAKSDCAALLPCDISEELGPDCLAQSLNQVLDGAMPDGLSYTDLEDASTSLLFFAIYDGEEAADGGSSDAQCRLEDLIACAGVTARLGGDGSYDITCASCQGGSRNPPAIDNGPCPHGFGAGCFLEGCAKLLADGGS